ncbi:hypothetical protein DPMN_060832 [Dreissena polymorpha]|uniref:Uncharacterized protein n=1 Tax=Dreissena polymorpha TaxID=45954 RepID=A0A9D4C6T3_DREPO|nr:hypothetical protein DPMN_060832 [Dreissena polymorpha]
MSLSKWLKTGTVQTRSPTIAGLPDPAKAQSTTELALLTQAANDSVEEMVNGRKWKRDKIFITNNSHHKVLTLARDGTVLQTFTDPDLQNLAGIHVTALGQVLVCGASSSTIIQLDGEGKKKLATLATKRDRLDEPNSVFYNRSTASIIVGQWSSILVLRSAIKEGRRTPGLVMGQCIVEINRIQLEVNRCRNDEVNTDGQTAEITTISPRFSKSVGITTLQ